jgi:hypothetical protein
MGGSRFIGIIACVLAAVTLDGCGVAANPTAKPGDLAPTPTATPCVSSTFDSIPDTLEPRDILMEAKVEGGRFPDASCRRPDFTLLANGRVIYCDYSGPRRQTMMVCLEPEEAKALVQQVLDLGLECVESWTSSFSPDRKGSETVVEKLVGGTTSIITVRLPNGDLRSISNYAGFANDPEALKAIEEVLFYYQHPEAQPFAAGTPCP